MTANIQCGKTNVIVVCYSVLGQKIYLPRKQHIVQVASFSRDDEDWLIQVSGTITHAEAAEKLNVSLDQLRGFLRKKILNGSNLISGLQKKTTG